MFPIRSTAAQQIEVTLYDDEIDEPDEQFTVTLMNPVAAALAGGGQTATVSATIEDDDDPPHVTIGNADLIEGAGDGIMRFAVTLAPPSARTVTVDYATADDTAAAGQDYTRKGGTLTFSAGTEVRTIAVPVANDTRDEADAEQFTVTLSAAVNAGLDSYQRTAIGTIRDDDPPPQLTIGDASLTERAGSVPFAVTLAAPSGRTVTVDYATADGTATAGADYLEANGTLTFPAGTTARTIAIPIMADHVDEDTETFTVTLGGATNATLPAPVATGTIADDDERGVQVEPAALTVPAGESGSYTVALTSQPTADVTVAITTSPFVSDVTVTPTVLTFTASTWATRQTVTVSTGPTAPVGGTVAIQHAPSGADYGGEPASALSVTIAEVAPLELGSLLVTGGGPMYPAFDGGVHHYAVTCADPATTLQVSAQALRTGARLTLLRANANDNHVSTGSLNTQVEVNSQHDVAIELSDGDDTITYVVHCIPADYPDIRILKKTEYVTDGLLLVAVRYEANRTRNTWVSILDNNGVPRFHKPRSVLGTNFRRQPTGPLVNGKRVRYSVSKDTVELLDYRFDPIANVEVAEPLTDTDVHDFMITENGNYLFISYDRTERDVCEAPDTCPDTYVDGVIQEVTPLGAVVFTWSSWAHINRGDCQRQTDDYAHLNSLDLIGGDIVASFGYCGQVFRIDRSSGTGNVVWQLGGSSPPRDPDTEYLEIVDDDDDDAGNEFCSQHSVKHTDHDTVVIFDNGGGCRGPRKFKTAFTRVVEYDISSGMQASLEHQFRLPSRYGRSTTRGGVEVLDNGRWLIAWNNGRGGVSLGDTIAVSEVDPVTGTVHLHMHMSKAGVVASTFRVYRESEADVPIPLNSP